MKNNSDAGQKIIPLNWVRGFAALMVVAYHCHLVMALPKYFNASVFPVFLAGDSGVQLFFVLSGFVIYLAHVFEPEGNRTVLIKFGFKRFRRVYVPLWAVLSTILPIVFIGVFGSRPSIWNICVAYLILPAASENILAVEWTLRHEMLFYLLFSVFLWRRWFGTAVLIIWGLAGSLFAMTINKTWIIVFFLNSNHMLFIFGIGSAWLYCQGGRRGGLASLAGGVTLFALTYAAKLSNALPYDVNVIFFGISAAAILYGLSSIHALSRPVWFLDKLGDSSYSLYLIHFPIVSALVKIAVIINQHIHLPLKIYFICIVSLCQLAAFLFHQRVEKPLIAWAGRFEPLVVKGRTTARTRISAAFEPPSPQGRDL